MGIGIGVCCTDLNCQYCGGTGIPMDTYNWPRIQCVDCGQSVPDGGLLFCECCEKKNDPRSSVPPRCVDCGGRLDDDGTAEKCHICCEYPSNRPV